VKWRLLTDVPDEEVRLLLSVARRRRFSERVTMVGSMIPFLTRSSSSPVSTFRPWPFLAARTWLTTTEPSSPAA
jgi:hypothetical protein